MKIIKINHCNDCLGFREPAMGLCFCELEKKSFAVTTKGKVKIPKWCPLDDV